ncbi:pentapeptide repeat-containing protein [Acaryochloris marina]|uniref:pentapeptide repeat-containing protein n=1 Tax=Acaryochloris marina TaxID=155978 RepID=UPI001BB0924D|nr:pentapeptide repeat-containing protein [Acaryochloris marina]QUY41628.1 pentapeptide repeat-containing protein [Acaryochloris marina S15]
MKPFLLGVALFSTLWICPVAQAENPEHLKQLMKSRSCPNCDLQGADLSAMNLRNANLAGANLTGANLNLADLTAANLSNAILTEASLAWTNFIDADLEGANLSQAKFEGGERLGQALSFEKATLPDGTIAFP